jgi:ABC-type Fe3+/spermidine/putrescine transport system ATPase subunit
MTSKLRCTDLRKRYPGQEGHALGTDAQGVSFDVREGELFALLGPSGCGKTTTLRIVGGFIDPDAGTVEIDGRDVTRRAPYDRSTNTVFQSYALFPHKDVAGNVAFGLKMDRVKRDERRRRVDEALALVGLAGMGARKVSELSGGQQQRAALARAIVKRPSVLLLDEPLGALDLKLRRQMQDEIVELKRSTGTTFVHVTHDQEEACAIADRIAVMRAGEIVQVDSPVALYRSPRTAYVAEFIDAGTIIRGEVRRDADVIEIDRGGLCLRAPSNHELNGAMPVAALLPRDRIQIRPGAGEPQANGRQGTVRRTLFTGSVFEVTLDLDEGVELQATVPHAGAGAIAAEELAVGSRVVASWAPEDVVLVRDE